MELTKEQMEFLNKVCDGKYNWAIDPKGNIEVIGDVDMRFMKLTEIPVKFGKIGAHFYCSNNQLTTLKNCPDVVYYGFDCSYNKLTSLEFAPTSVWGDFYCSNNQLTNYFKNIKEEDFPHWDKLYWGSIIEEYPFLINTGKKYMTKEEFRGYLEKFPQTKIYLE